MPDARCTRGLVCELHKEMCTRANRFSGGNPAFPAQGKIMIATNFYETHMEILSP